MKLFYTLVQDFTPNADRDLGLYLINQQIDYDLGADYAEELRSRGFKGSAPNMLLKKYVVLIEEHELSAIMLSVSGVSAVDNDNWIKLKNRLRRCFSWFL